MFDRDRWAEIWQTLSRNRLRSFLTMFGVGWGIFMLTVMLGMGKGLENAVLGGFDRVPPNTGVNTATLVASSLSRSFPCADSLEPKK